ncbi:MAG: hypothetical protein P8Y71_14125 [Pseudolabrys sp.]
MPMLAGRIGTLAPEEITAGVVSLATAIVPTPFGEHYEQFSFYDAAQHHLVKPRSRKEFPSPNEFNRGDGLTMRMTIRGTIFYIHPSCGVDA